jgi:hypothetical protein
MRLTPERDDAVAAPSALDEYARSVREHESMLSRANQPVAAIANSGNKGWRNSRWEDFATYTVVNVTKRPRCTP